MEKKRIQPVLSRIGKDIRAYWMFGLTFAVYDILTRLVFDAFCPVAIVTGLPCPGCGMTRAVLFFATGQIQRGWKMNPIGIGWLVLAVYFCMMRYWFGKRPRGVLQAGGVLTVCMVIFYAYRMYRIFPGDAPVCYTDGCVLERLLPGYRAFLLNYFAGRT